MGKSDYVRGEGNQPTSFRLNPSEMPQSAPEAPTDVKLNEPTPPAIATIEENKPKARSRSKKPKEPKEAPLVSGQKSVTQTTTEKFIAPVTAPNGNGHSIEPDFHPAEKLINAKVNDDSYEVVIYNLQDAQEYPAPKNSTVQDIRAFIRSRYGNGQYRLKVFRNGVPIENESGFMPMRISDAPVVAPRTIEADADPVADAKKKAAVERANAEAMRAKADADKIQADIERDRRKRDKEQKNEDEAPQNAALAALQKQLEDMQKKLDEANKPKSNPTTDALLAAAISALPKVLENLTAPKKSNDEGVSSLVREMQHSTEKMLTQMQNSQEKMMIQITNRIEKLEDKKNDTGSFKERLEEIMMISDMVRPKDDDDFDIDPERPISSAIAGLIKHGIKAVGAIAKDPAMGETIRNIAANMGKTPETLTPDDLSDVTNELEAIKNANIRQQQPRLPAPVPAHKPIIQLPPPTRLSDSLSGLKVAQNPAVAVEPVSASPVRVSGESIPSAVTPVPSAATPVSNGESSRESESLETPPPLADHASAPDLKVGGDNLTPSPVAPVVQTETPKPTAETPATETLSEPAISQADIADDLRETITNTVRQMVLDLDSERTLFKWWDLAYAEWPKKFMEAFIQPEEWQNKFARLKLHCDAEVWAELDKRLTNEKHLMNCSGSIQTFMQQMNAPAEVTTGAAQ